MRADCVCPGLNIGRAVSSVAIRYIAALQRLCGPGNLEALPLENIFQPVQWLVIGELAGYDAIAVSAWPLQRSADLPPGAHNSGRHTSCVARRICNPA